MCIRPYQPFEEAIIHAERIGAWFVASGRELLTVLNDPALRAHAEPERAEILSVCREIADVLLAGERRECARLLRQRRGQLNGRPL